MITLGKKRSCEGCRAIEIGQYTSKCVLGYSYNNKFEPQEPCPKPKTWKDYYECEDYYRKL